MNMATNNTPANVSHKYGVLPVYGPNALHSSKDADAGLTRAGFASGNSEPNARTAPKNRELKTIHAMTSARKPRMILASTLIGDENSQANISSFLCTGLFDRNQHPVVKALNVVPACQYGVNPYNLGARVRGHVVDAIEPILPSRHACMMNVGHWRVGGLAVRPSSASWGNVGAIVSVRRA
jgi:hypothetical protein